MAEKEGTSDSTIELKTELDDDSTEEFDDGFEMEENTS